MCEGGRVSRIWSGPNALWQALHEGDIESGYPKDDSFNFHYRTCLQKSCAHDKQSSIVKQMCDYIELDS